MASKQKGSAKIGRNAKWCQGYKLVSRREQNKAMRLVKHLKRLPGDSCALNAFKVAVAVLPVHVSRKLSALLPA